MAQSWFRNMHAFKSRARLYIQNFRRYTYFAAAYTYNITVLYIIHRRLHTMRNSRRQGSAVVLTYTPTCRFIQVPKYYIYVYCLYYHYYYCRCCCTSYAKQTLSVYTH